MMERTRRIVGLVALALAAAGCASTAELRLADREAYQSLAEERVGSEYSGDGAVTERIGEILAAPLSMDAAVELALLRNPGLRREYESIGMARGELLEAAAVENPILEFGRRTASGGASGTQREWSITQNVLDLLMRPARRRIADLELQRARLGAVDAVLEVVAETRTAWLDLVAGIEEEAARGRVRDAAAAAAELARRQREAGNLNALEYAEHRAMAAEAEGEWTMARMQLSTARERLARALGSEEGAAEGWRVEERLPPLPRQEVASEGLEALALENRLDLAAARLEVEELAAALRMTVRWRWFALAEFGVSREEEIDGVRLEGPHLAIQLPIFDRGRGRVERMEALERAARARLTEIAVRARSEVRESAERVDGQRRRAEHFRDRVVPAREEVLREAQKHYNYMLLGNYRLLEARRETAHARIEAVASLRSYWEARVELERAVGRPVPLRESTAVEGREESAEPAEPEPPAQQQHQHHEHSMNGERR